MKNFIELGEAITATAIDDVTSGVPVIIEGLLLVPKQDAVADEEFAAMFRGGFILDKASGVAVKQFEPAYFDAANSVVTNVAGDNLAGVFLDAAEGGDAGATVLLTGEVQVPAATGGGDAGDTKTSGKK